jgi:hypothetical protein
MIPENINPGTPNQKDGDKLRDAFVKTITIFTDIYTKLFTTTSELTNNGADGVNPFITANDINNFSRTISVTSDDLIGVTGNTLEEQIVAYVNSLSYLKQETDSDIWIEYSELGIFTQEFTDQFA